MMIFFSCTLKNWTRPLVEKLSSHAKNDFTEQHHKNLTDFKLICLNIVQSQQISDQLCSKLNNI